MRVCVGSNDRVSSVVGAESGKVQKKRRVRTAIKTVTTTTERERE